jgi:hypothetical protein
MEPWVASEYCVLCDFLIFISCSPQRVHISSFMLYFQWLALCVLSYSLLVTEPSIRCGNLLPPELHESILKDCRNASLALFALLPCPPSAIHRRAYFSCQKELIVTGYRLPKRGRSGRCAIDVSIAVGTPHKRSYSTIGKLSENLTKLYDQCLYRQLHEGGTLTDEGIVLEIGTALRPASRRTEHACQWPTCKFRGLVG